MKAALVILAMLAGCGGGAQETDNADESHETAALATVCNFASIDDANRAMANGVLCRIYAAANNVSE